MKKEIDYLIIEKYILNELKGEELLNFEKKLKEDTEFAQEVTLYKEINNTLSSKFSNYAEENKLRNTLEDLNKIHISKPVESQIKDEFSKREIKVFSLRKYSKYLLAASLVLFASLIWMNSTDTVNYSDYGTHDLLELTVRGDNNEHETIAQKAFNAKDYALAQKELEFLLAEDSTKVELQLYLAICMMEQNKFELADSILTKIAQGNSVYKDKAIWNLALSKLKQKDLESCKNILNRLPKDADNYIKAKELLKKL